MKRNDLDEIMDKLSGRLGEEERAALEKELTNHPDMDREAHQAILHYIEQSGDREKRDWLKTIIPKYEATKKINKKSTLRWLIPLAAAASLLLFFLAGPLWSPSSAPQLAKTHLQAYELTFGNRSDAENDFLQAGQYYQSGNYTAAIPLLQRATAESSDGKYDLALGISYLKIQKSNLAIESLRPLISLPDPVYHSHAQWYTALAHLQLDQATAAVPFLEILAKNSLAFNHTKAKELLQQKIFIKK